MSAAPNSVSSSSYDEFLRIIEKNRAGEAVGVYSVCAAHPIVLEAAMRQALQDDALLLIEATANQVNQFGGYTGMTPADFPPYVHSIADSVGLPRDRLILGGDHLGPLCWTDDAPEQAMEKACKLVAAYVEAGFQKIHLDASMACAGDVEPLSDEIVAARAAAMCKAAEQASQAASFATRPVYVIGTEVPVPGGETEGLDEIAVTAVAHAELTVETHRRVFASAGLSDAWDRVVALVVQPGVEFNHTDVYEYRLDDARDLSQAILKFPGFVYEAHSTDYQPKNAYSELVRDHFAILKVGPQLTFALREALFALAAIEDQLVSADERSNLVDVAERVMLDEPGHWITHYPTTEPEGQTFRRYSYSDRIRYYWPHPSMKEAVDKLISNLDSVEIPLPLLSQFLPGAVGQVAMGNLSPTPHELVVNHVMAVTESYSEACRYDG